MDRHEAAKEVYMAGIPLILLTILALAAMFLVTAIGIPLLVVAIVVIVIRKQRKGAVPAVAAAGAAGTPTGAVESADSP